MRKAEGVGFEPTIPCGIRDFQARALGHYAIPPSICILTCYPLTCHEHTLSIVFRIFLVYNPLTIPGSQEYAGLWDIVNHGR